MGAKLDIKAKLKQKISTVVGEQILVLSSEFVLI